MSTPNGTGYEPRSVQSAALSSSTSPSSTTPVHRLDLRWGRLTFAQLRDEEFLAKQLRRIEITQGARRVGRPSAYEAAGLTGSSPEKTIRQRLLAAQTKAARGASEDDEFDVKEETLVAELTVKTLDGGDAEETNERELTNALCVLGDLHQPELAALMVTKLKEELRRGCAFPNPVYQLIALRRQLMKSMHEAVAAQHRQRKAAVQLHLAIAKCMDTSLQSTSELLGYGPAADPVGLLTGAATVKPKEKVVREAAMGIQVLVGLLSDLHDPAVTTLAQRREFLEDLLPLLSSMGFLALSPRRGHGGSVAMGLGALTGRGSGSARWLGSSGPLPDITEFTDKMQRFLLDMCPRPTNIPSSSPKLPAISSGNGELDVVDRTNAVNGLIHLAAATGSVRDFLVVLRVLLGAGDYMLDTGAKELRSSLSSRVLLTSSVPSLATFVRIQQQFTVCCGAVAYTEDFTSISRWV
ncbi:hect e3 ubiquitin [Phytophthora cinnamomi]|uniref:hect e3 ubiquitin n=1 Tax=Phytophthora cinnamomi TaxID=4785 RepID=UPI00355A2F92|nr:hect e3 ubiquitin [Phytophthora cinnamomi]